MVSGRLLIDCQYSRRDGLLHQHEKQLPHAESTVAAGDLIARKCAAGFGEKVGHLIAALRARKGVP